MQSHHPVGLVLDEHCADWADQGAFGAKPAGSGPEATKSDLPRLERRVRDGSRFSDGCPNRVAKYRRDSFEINDPGRKRENTKAQHPNNDMNIICYKGAHTGHQSLERIEATKQQNITRVS
jgi:hypothetical protein